MMDTSSFLHHKLLVFMYAIVGGVLLWIHQARSDGIALVSIRPSVRPSAACLCLGHRISSLSKD